MAGLTANKCESKEGGDLWFVDKTSKIILLLPWMKSKFETKRGKHREEVRIGVNHNEAVELASVQNSSYLTSVFLPSL